MPQSILNFLNVNKSYLALLAVIVMQLAQANHWLVVPSDTMNLLIGLASGAGLVSIGHSNAAATKMGLKSINDLRLNASANN
jgi:hypothetical protein